MKTSALISRFQETTGVEMWEAAKQLVKGRHRDSVAKLVLVLAQSKDLDHRIAAAWALGAIGARAALDPLVGILQDRTLPPNLREQAAESLGYLCDDRARVPLIACLSDKHADVVFSCLFALRTVGTKADIPILSKFIQDDRKNSYGASLSEESNDAIDQIRSRDR